jgi:hypothetical protein
LAGVQREESLPSFFLFFKLGAIGSAYSYRFHMIFFFSFNWPRSDLVDVNGAMIELPLRRPVSYALSFS